MSELQRASLQIGIPVAVVLGAVVVLVDVRVGGVLLIGLVAGFVVAGAAVVMTRRRQDRGG